MSRSAEPAGATAPAPRANPDLLGQEAAEAVLVQAWRSGRLPHAWLLTGPEGIGKATLAYRFARFVLAARGPAAAREGLPVAPDSPLFRRVASGGHPDLLSVERGYDEKRDRRRSEILVSDVRAVAQFLRLTPAEGGWRIVVVDAAEDMNRNAANALLKVLEEPPKQALLLLVSHAPGLLLPTVRSRCRRLALQPLGGTVMAELLARYGAAAEPADRVALAALAEGSIGRAMALAAEGGLDLYRDVTALVQSLPRLDAERLHALGDRLARPGAEAAFSTAAALLCAWMARMIRFGATGRPPAEVLPGEGTSMRQLLDRRPLDQWLVLWEKIARLFATAESANLDRKQVWIGAFLDIEGLVRP